MTTPEDERRVAIRAMDATCPHCGAERAPDQAFCVECGYALPPVRGRVAGLRRRWVRRFGWYPGDWIWASLALLAIAIVGIAASIEVSNRRDSGGGHVITALAGQAVEQPVAAPAVTAAAGTLPTPPEPGTTTTKPGKAKGNQQWPAGENGWTIVLVSYPKTAGLPTAQATARKAARTLPEVGVLDSSRYASLQPGYFVVFSGIYQSQAEANSSVNTAHSAGFGAAYSRQIAG